MEESAQVNPIYARLLRLVLRQLGTDADGLLGAAGVDPQGLMTSSTPLGLPAVSRVITSALRTTGRPWLGLELGLATEVGSHGAVGLAVVSSPDVRAALQAISRYAPTRSSLLRWHLEEAPDVAWLRVEPTVPLGANAQFVLEMVLGTVARMLGAVLGSAAAGLRVELPWQAPPWRTRYERLGDWHFRFGAATLAFGFPSSWLSLPSFHADVATHAAARRECEEALQSQQRLRAGSVAQRVRERLRDCEGAGYPTLDALAGEWRLSPRTLIRHLGQEGTRYQVLLDEARQGQALWYLQRTSLPVEEIAARLGYADTSNFSRTCRRWFGTTAQALRERVDPVQRPSDT
jgi:AraC-like DNA-binding protein